MVVLAPALGAADGQVFRSKLYCHSLTACTRMAGAVRSTVPECVPDLTAMPRGRRTAGFLRRISAARAITSALSGWASTSPCT